MLGFYLVSSDRDLVIKLREVLRQKGYLGYFDAAGRVNYLVQHDQNPYQTGMRILNLAEQCVFAEPSAATRYSAELPTLPILKRSCGELLDELGFVRTLRGTEILMDILPRLCFEEQTSLPLNKGIYPMAARTFEISPSQVDRVLRYAISKSRLSGIGNAACIHELLHKLRNKVENASTPYERGTKSDMVEK